MNKIFVYESLSDYVKPKSQEEIINIIKSAPPDKKIEYACQANILWVVKEAIKEGATEESINHAFQIAVSNNHFEIIKYLLINTIIREKTLNGHYGFKCLWSAILNKQYDIIKLLLKKPELDLCYNNTFIFDYAFQKGEIEVLKWLLNDPRSQDCLTKERYIYYKNKIRNL